MEIIVSDIGAIKVVRLPSQMDDLVAEKAEATLQELVSAGHVKILCDLSSTETISPAGIKMFINAFKTIHEHEGQMAFCLLQPGVREIFVEAGLTHIYKYYDLGEALQVSVLKELSDKFDEYTDVHEIRLQRMDDYLRIDLFLEFDGEKSMAVVQQSMDRIRENLENKIKGSEVCIIPTTSREKREEYE